MQKFLTKLFDEDDFKKYDEISRRIVFQNISFFVRIFITIISFFTPILYIFLINNALIQPVNISKFAQDSDIFIFQVSHTLDTLCILFFTPIILLLIEYLISILFKEYSMHITLNSVFIDRKSDSKILRKLKNISAAEKVCKLRSIIIRKLSIYSLILFVSFLLSIKLEEKQMKFINDQGIFINKYFGTVSKFYNFSEIEKIETSCKYHNSMYQQRVLRLDWEYIVYLKNGFSLDLTHFSFLSPNKVDQLIKFHNKARKAGVPYRFDASGALDVDAATCADYLRSMFIMENDSEKLINILSITDSDLKD